MFDEFEDGAEIAPAYDPGVLTTRSGTRAAGKKDVTGGLPKTRAVYTMLERPQFNPGGASIYAIQNYGTPDFLPIGAAILVRGMPRVFEGAVQAYIPGDVSTTAGGFIPGQIIGQPLFDANSNSYGGWDIEE